MCVRFSIRDKIIFFVEKTLLPWTLLFQFIYKLSFNWGKCMSWNEQRPDFAHGVISYKVYFDTLLSFAWYHVTYHKVIQMCKVLFERPDLSLR